MLATELRSAREQKQRSQLSRIIWDAIERLLAIVFFAIIVVAAIIVGIGFGIFDYLEDCKKYAISGHNKNRKSGGH